MSNNVRCAGTPIVTRMRETPDEYDEMPPCGWKGERFPAGWVPHTHSGPCAICMRVETRMTTKPCPQCGGRVELIPPEVTP